MPDIKFLCPQCQAGLKMREEYAGRKIKCPKCTCVCVIPSPEPAQPVEPPEQITTEPAPTTGGWPAPVEPSDQYDPTHEESGYPGEARSPAYQGYDPGTEAESEVIEEEEEPARKGSSKLVWALAILLALGYVGAIGLVYSGAVGEQHTPLTADLLLPRPPTVPEGLKKFGTVVRKGNGWSVTLTSSGTEKEFAEVARTPNIVEIIHRDTASPVSDACLAHLRGMKELRWLDCPQARDVTDAGLAHLAHVPTLTSLTLGNTKATGAGLVHLKVLRSLRTLNLANNPLGDSLGHLASLPELSELDLPSCQVGDDGLRRLRGLTKVTRLNLMGNQGITDAGLEHLKGMLSLQILNLQGTQVTQPGLTAFRAARPFIQVLR